MTATTAAARHRPRLRTLAALLAAASALALARADDKPDPAVGKFRERLGEKGADREKLRREVLAYARKNAGTPAAVEAARVLGELPAPPDLLDASKVPELDRFDWQPKKELVAVLGEHRGRHGAAVRAVAYCKNGKRVVSGGDNGHVRVWDPATLRQQHLMGTGSATLCVAVTRDGKTVAAGNSTGGLYVWDVSGKQPVQTGAFTIGTSPVNSVDISPDDKVLAAGVYDGLVHLIDLAGPRPEKRTQLAGHKTAVQAVRFAPAAKKRTLATGSSDGVVRFWGVGKDSVQELGQTEAHPKGVSVLAYAPGGQTLAAGLADGTVWLWNTSGARAARRTAFKAHAGAVVALAYAPGGATLATGGAGGAVRLWDNRAAVPKVRAAVEGHFGAVPGLAFAPDGRSLATGGLDWTVRLWNVSGSRPAQRFLPMRGHWARPNAVRFSPDGRFVASAGEDRTVRVWDLKAAAGTQTALFRGEPVSLRVLAYSPDGKALAFGGASTTVHLWDVARRTELRAFRGHPSHVWHLDYLPDGGRLLASSGTALVLWNANTAREVSRFEGHDQRINTLALAPDGRHALTGTGYYKYDEKGKHVLAGGKYVYVDCTLRLWDLQNGTLAREVKDLSSPVTNVAFTPEGRRAACSLWNDDTHLWRVSPDALEDEGELKTTAVRASLHVFSPDGRKLLTMGNDWRLVLYDLAAKRVAWQWSSQEYVAGVAFSPDCRYLAVGIQTGPVYVLRLAPPPAGASR